MAITVCFINEEWKLVSNTISVRILVGKHYNESLKEALIESFIEWDILLKVANLKLKN